MPFQIDIRSCLPAGKAGTLDVRKKSRIHHLFEEKLSLLSRILHQQRPGFMFIDLLLTLLFATTLIMLLLVTATTLTQTFKTNLQSIATRIATKKIEDLRKTSYASLPTNGYFSDPDLIKLPSGSANLTMVNYQSSVDIKQATITVNWIQNEAPKQIIINTLIYKNGI